jgi:hypothetical protein
MDELFLSLEDGAYQADNDEDICDVHVICKDENHLENIRRLVEHAAIPSYRPKQRKELCEVLRDMAENGDRWHREFGENILDLYDAIKIGTEWLSEKRTQVIDRYCQKKGIDWYL